MIVSASYRTDIPAFYGPWFMNRLRAGFCKVVNPYGDRAHRVELTRESVDGFVFWTRNLGPFLKHLREIKERKFPFMVSYTITGYPRLLEKSVINPSAAMEHMKCLTREHGTRVGVWRYDPIIFSSITPPEFHIRNFSRLAQSLAGLTNEVIISFAHIYQKTRRALDRAATGISFSWEDPPDEVKIQLARELAHIAKSWGMQLSICGQRKYCGAGILDARCIDAERLSDCAGRKINVPHKGHRHECGCYESRDIGRYDTCPHGCVYCYAVGSSGEALRRYHKHRPEGEFLMEPTMKSNPEETQEK